MSRSTTKYINILQMIITQEYMIFPSPITTILLFQAHGCEMLWAVRIN